MDLWTVLSILCISTAGTLFAFALVSLINEASSPTTDDRRVEQIRAKGRQMRAELEKLTQEYLHAMGFDDSKGGD